jgi:hypothetical protein
LYVIEYILQTNSTVTTTILQQQPPPINDWIMNGLLHMTLTDWITVAITGALVYYAYRTVEEGKKDRYKDSLEKRLEKLYNPMFEILTRAEERIETKSDGKDYKYQMLRHSDHEKLCNIVENHSHYLRKEEYQKTKQMLSHVQYLKDYAVYQLKEYDECLGFASARRDELADWLREVSE